MTRDALAARYGIEFERFSGIGLDEQAQLYGDALWARQPDACCGIRKVEPMREALTGIDCWVSGIRREDSQTRAGAAKFGWDKRFGLWKLNPLADWTEAEVWDYINEHEIPYNPLHDAGYPVDRLHPLHPPAGRRREPPLRPLGRRPQDRVRPARLTRSGLACSFPVLPRPNPNGFDSLNPTLRSTTKP